MKTLKNILVGLMASLLTVFATYGGYTLYAATQTDVKDYLTFKNPNDSFENIQSAYHHSMNEYFNDKLERLVVLLEDDNFYKHIDFNPPEGNTSCSATNVSSYCIGQGAIDIYISYVTTLNQLKANLPTDNLPEGATAKDLLIKNSERNAKVDDEVEEAKIVMEGAVKMYDEFRLAYPMHKRYEEIIKNLIKYKISLSKITKEVNKFPLKFIDASSSECK